MDIEEVINDIAEWSETLGDAERRRMTRLLQHVDRLRGYIRSLTICCMCGDDIGHSAGCPMIRHPESSVYLDLELAREIYNGEDR